MKKVLLSLALSLFCFGCPTNNNASKDASPDVDIQEVSLTNEARKIDIPELSILLPDGWQEISSPRPDIIIFATNLKSEQMIMIMKEEYNLTYDLYLINTIRSLKQDGIKVSHIEEIDKDNMRFAFLKTSQEEVNVWLWLTVRNRYSLVFSCGSANTKDLNDCAAIFNSMVLK